MANSIFIGNNFVWGIEYEDKGTPIIKKYVEIPIQEGTIINGNVLNMGELTEKLTILRKEHGFETATLLIDTSEVQSTSTVVPHLNKLEYQRIAESELNRDSVADRLIHYKISKNNRSGETTVLFAAAIPSSIVESYKELFSIAGIKLKAIKILEEAVDSMYEAKILVPEENTIINVISSDIMYTSMYAKGKRIFSQRTRLGLDTHGLEFELESSLTNLEQFNRAQRNGDPEKVYYLGLDDEILAKLKTDRVIDVPLEKINLDAYIDEQLTDIKTNPVFMSIFDNHSLDLLKPIKTADELAERTMTFVQKMALGIVGVGMIGTLIMGGVILFHTMGLKSLNDFVNDPINATEYQEVSQIKEELTNLESVIAQVEFAENYIGDYNIVEIPLMEDIQLVGGGGARLLSISFDQETNIVSATLETKDASSASEYVRELKRMGFNVADIQYTGYAESNPHIYLFTANIIPENNKEIFEKSIDYTYADQPPIVEQSVPIDGETTLEETPETTGDTTTVDDAISGITDTESVGGVINE